MQQEGFVISNGLVAAFVVVAVILLGFTIRHMLRRQHGIGNEIQSMDDDLRPVSVSMTKPTLLVEAPQIADYEGPRCIACDEPATEPSPMIARGRGLLPALRDALGMPPRYRRAVPLKGTMVKLEYCRSHAHTADAMTTEFLAKTRELVAESYTQVAKRVAAFEREELPKLVVESMTDNQRRDAKRRETKRQKGNGALAAEEAAN